MLLLLALFICSGMDAVGMFEMFYGVCMSSFRFLFMSLCSHLVFKENNGKRFYSILKHAWLHK